MMFVQARTAVVLNPGSRELLLLSGLRAAFVLSPRLGQMTWAALQPELLHGPTSLMNLKQHTMPCFLFSGKLKTREGGPDTPELMYSDIYRVQFDCR